MLGTNNHDATAEVLQPSFWDYKQYLRTVKRTDNGNKICSELCVLLHERAEIEKIYSTNVKKWSNKLMAFIQSDLLYNSSHFPLKGFSNEADAIANAHMAVRNVLMEEVQTELKHWQKENYPKTQLPLQTVKISKQFEQEFEQAQKPWAKRSKKVHHCKKEYYQACKTERYLQVQVQNAKSELSGNTEQPRKLQEKWEKAVKEVETTRAAYQKAVDDLKIESPRYLEEMTKVFSQTQEFERKRLAFLNSVYADLAKALNITNHADFPQIYDDLLKEISKGNEDSDLAWWSANHGVDMPYVLPEFDEYSPELMAIVNKKKGGSATVNSNVTVTGITPVISSPQPIPPSNDSNSSSDPVAPTTNGRKQSLPTPFDDDLSPEPNGKSADFPEGEKSVGQMSSAATGSADIGVDADDYTSATYDDGQPGIKVRALYDYTGVEDDEISFQAGDVFEKLEEADEQGWCKGRKDSRAGLYPANYAEEI